MSYTVTIQPSGHQFTIEYDETILEAALRQGYALPYGCRNGACGSCLGTKLEGEVEYIGPTLALTDGDKAAGKVLFCQAQAVSDLTIEVKEIGAAKDIEIKILPCRVQKMEQLTHDVMQLGLKLPATERLQFLAGQYIDILLKDGRRRSFSIANAPHDDALLELHIRQIENGSFTSHVFDGMKPKDLLRIEGPLGSFFLREESENPIIMMAGGTGFAPVKGIVQHAIAEGLKRPIHLYWGVRAKRDLYMAELAQSWATEHENIEFIPVLSEPMDDENWQGRTGFVHEAVCEDFESLAEFDIYACGPPVMIQSGKDAFIDKGMDEDNYFFDSFDFAADSQPA